MSDTTYVHEVTRGSSIRVTLTMDADEVQALADIATAAVDAAVLVPGAVSEVVEGNAANVAKWATRAAATLALTAGLYPDDKE
ncbi:MAG TPA: hypothetical protein VF867_12540 [Arthrobacter sp.]